MFQATCSECGNKCEVPFRPTSGKPVLCSTCFGQQKDKQQGRSGGRDFGRSGDRQMFSAVCDKCGGKAEVPFKPTAGKPIFCSDCFSKESRPGDSRGDWRGGDKQSNVNRDTVGNKQLSEQLKSVSTRLDKVIDILTGTADKSPSGKSTEGRKKSEPKKPEAKEKVKKKAVKKKVKSAKGGSASGRKVVKKKK